MRAEACTYPIQRALTQAMRSEAVRAGKSDAMQAWAGQSARLAQDVPAEELVKKLWSDALQIMELSTH